MVKKCLMIEGNGASISDLELKKRVTKVLKSKKITPKNDVMMYLNTTEWKVYVVVDKSKEIIKIDLKEN